MLLVSLILGFLIPTVVEKNTSKPIFFLSREAFLGRFISVLVSLGAHCNSSGNTMQWIVKRISDCITGNGQSFRWAELHAGFGSGNF